MSYLQHLGYRTAELLPQSLQMRPFPVHIAADPASRKTDAMEENVLRNKIPYRFFFLDTVKKTITTGAPSRTEFPDVKGPQHLNRLFGGMIGMHEDEVLQVLDLQEMAVLREYHPSLLKGQPQDFAVPNVRIIECVETEEPEPTSESAQHCVSDETQRKSLCPLTHREGQRDLEE